jgi:hypothetical protein
MVTLFFILTLFGMFAGAFLSLGKGFDAFCSGLSKVRPTKAPTPPTAAQVYVIVIENGSAPRAIPPSQEAGLRPH